MWVNSRCAIAAWLECFQEKPRTVSEWTGLPGEESVKRFERSNGLDTALYKIIPLPLPLPFIIVLSGLLDVRDFDMLTNVGVFDRLSVSQKLSVLSTTSRFSTKVMLRFWATSRKLPNPSETSGDATSPVVMLTRSSGTVSRSNYHLALG